MNLVYRVPKHAMLSKQEELVLLTNWLNNNCIRSRNKLVERNMMFIIKVATSYRKKYSHVPLSDLIGYASLGFIDGLSKVDLDKIVNKGKGIRVYSYVVYWVIQKIQRGAEDNESAIRLPANHHEVMRRKVSKDIDLAEHEIVWMDNVRGANKTEDKLGGIDSHMTIGEKYAFTNFRDEDCPDNILLLNERNAILHGIVNDLDTEEKTVMTKMFGLDGRKQMNLREIGDSMGISHEKVRKLRATSLERLSKRVTRNM